MKVREAIPIVLLLPIFGFIAYEVVSEKVDAARERTTAAIARAPLDDSLPPAPPALVEEPPMVASGGSSDPAPESAPGGPRDVPDILRRIALGVKGTYLNEIIVERDSALARWPERVDRPLRIWVANGSALPGWNEHYPNRVREAFDTWSLTGVPVKFTYVRDSIDADVLVQWVDRFEMPITGRTLWMHDRNWWIKDGSITIALHHQKGEPLDEKSIHAIALHEVGHLLGLDHSSDTANIMTPRVRVRELSDADRATMRLLYSLPPGSLKN